MSTTADKLCVAILGLGEAGARFAADLAAGGVDVRAWDPDPARLSPGARAADGPAGAVAGCDVVLSLNNGSVAVDAAREALPGLSPGAVYADLNTAPPQVKRAVADVIALSGALFADVALLGPVPLHGLGVPAFASGDGAEEFARRLRPLGMRVEAIEGPAGAAAARKLVRSVFMKGLAAAAVESLRAAEAAGCGEWLRADLARVLDGPGEPLLERLLDGSRRHAVRREAEMQAALELLEELGVEPRVTVAARGWLEELAAEEAGVR